jgi:DNA modification methylase
MAAKSTVPAGSGRKSERDPMDRYYTPWPVALGVCQEWRHAIQGSAVLDPFTGSGSTGVAAIATGRRFVGIEQSPNYLEVAARRLSEAERAAAGQLFGPRTVATQGGLFGGGR